MTNLYDEVLYPSGLYPQTHPDRLAMIATVFGMSPPSVERCRVLELACNDGTNLIAMAYALPQSRFVGVDLAGKPIASGQAIIEELGLKNIELRQLDLLQTPAELGPFDFIIAHGLYSWLPAEARDKLMAVCGRHLTENGVAYISYNVYPGSHFRDLTRGMMRYHVAKFSGADEKIRQARALLKALAEPKENPEPYHLILQREMDRALGRSDAAVFHDDLNSINQPVYFHEFVQHAARHGLQYLSEASLRAMQIGSYPPNVMAHLNNLDAADVIRREQYGDFLKCRPFRQTLLCRNGIALERSLNAERLYRLRFAADIRPASPLPDLGSVLPQSFKAAAGAELVTDRPLVKIALAKLGTVWPQSVGFNDLLKSSDSELSDNFGGQEQAERELREALLQAHLAGHIEIHAHEARLVTSLPERPVASALARLQLRRGIAISTLLHQSIKVENPLSRNLVLLLDGTRNFSTLLADLADLVRSGEATVPGNDERICDIDAALAELSDGLEKNLRDLARLGILIG
jgi:methyltransferase-like protein